MTMNQDADLLPQKTGYFEIIETEVDGKLLDRIVCDWADIEDYIEGFYKMYKTRGMLYIIRESLMNE